MKKIRVIDDLYPLQRMHGLDELVLDLTHLLRGNLPLFAIRRSLFALREGASLIIQAPETVDSVNLLRNKWSFQFVVQLVAKACDELAEIRECNTEQRWLRCVRVAPPLCDGPWSAAIVYSGQPSEREMLHRCLDSIWSQSALSGGGQVLVCGPQDAAVDVEDFPNTEYLAHDVVPSSGRFMIGLKKMHAINALRNERILVCHTRICLDSEALYKLPREFDAITPQIRVRGKVAALPYLDLGFFHSQSVSLYSAVERPTLTYPRSNWMAYLERFYPYIDGGLVCTRKSLVARLPISTAIAWGEGEDAEWALRLTIQGKLLELNLDASAISMTCKIPTYATYGHQPFYKPVAAVARIMKKLGVSWRLS